MSEQPWSSLITLEDVYELHRIGIEQHGGPKIVVKPDTEDCLEGKFGTAWYSELYRAEEAGALPGLCFAGHALYYLAKSQCFTDGNKRIAWAATMAILASRGLTVRATEKEAVEYVLLIATNQIASGADIVCGSQIGLKRQQNSFTWSRTE